MTGLELVLIIFAMCVFLLLIGTVIITNDKMNKMDEHIEETRVNIMNDLEMLRQCKHQLEDIRAQVAALKVDYDKLYSKMVKLDDEKVEENTELPLATTIWTVKDKSVEGFSGALHVQLESEGIIISDTHNYIKITFDQSKVGDQVWSFYYDFRYNKYEIWNETKRRKVIATFTQGFALSNTYDDAYFDGRAIYFKDDRKAAYRLTKEASGNELYLVLEMPEEPWCQDDWQKEADTIWCLLDIEAG